MFTSLCGGFSDVFWKVIIVILKKTEGQTIRCGGFADGCRLCKYTSLKG